MASFSGNDRPPKPPDIGTGGKPLTSSSIITQHQAITPTELEEIAAKKSLPEKFHSAGITTSGHTQTSDLHRSMDDGPCSVDPNQGHNFSQPSLQLHEFSPEHCPVATVAEQPTNNGDSSSVRRTHGLGPHGHSSSSSGAHNHTMGQDQFPPKLDEFMLEVQALFDKFGYKEFDVSMLLQMLNSLRGSSIDDGITVDHQPIASNDNQISGTNPSKVRFCEIGQHVSIEPGSEVFSSNSNNTTVIEGQRMMGNSPIERIDTVHPPWIIGWKVITQDYMELQFLIVQFQPIP